MRKFLLGIVIVSLILIEGNSSEKDILLTLPVRILDANNTPIDNLTKNDFNLVINSEQRDIVEVLKRHRSFGKTGGYQSLVSFEKTSDTGSLLKDRFFYSLEVNPPNNFVLIFNISDYWHQIRKGISCFITDILRDQDRLVIQTPLKFYRIAVGKDKQVLIKEIQKLVKRDVLEYRNNMNSNRKTISEIITDFYRGGSDSTLSIIGKSPNEIANFLKNYLREFIIFKNKYIYPYFQNIDKAIALLTKQEGEKWLIILQEREIIPDISNFRKIANKISDYAATISGSDNAKATMLYTDLNVIDKTFLISKDLPFQKIRDDLLARNISYNVILMKNQSKNTEFGDNISPDFENIFSTISPSTGGKTIISSDLTESLGIISNFTDTYYNLVFKFNGKIEAKTLMVELLNKDASCYHKQLFDQAEIEFIITEFKKPKVKIADVFIKGNALRFSVSGFKQEVFDKEKSGVLEILVELLNQKDEIVYQTQNTLKSHQKSISISLNFPERFKGDFKLRLSAFDKLAKKSSHILKSCQF